MKRAGKPSPPLVRCQIVNWAFLAHFRAQIDPNDGQKSAQSSRNFTPKLSIPTVRLDIVIGEFRNTIAASKVTSVASEAV